MRILKNLWIISCVSLLCGLVAHPAAASATFSVTAEQEQEVKAAVQRLKENGLPEPLPEVPAEVSQWESVMLSDAVSVVDVAYVDFQNRQFYLSVKNPWTNAQQWYGLFPLDNEAEY